MTGERIIALLASGELAQIARAHPDQPSFCAALGISPNAYRNAVTRHRRAGRPFPTFAELSGVPRLGNRKPDMGIDPSIAFDDEPTEERPLAPGVSDQRSLAGPESAQAPRSIADDLADRKQRAETSSLRSRLKDALDQLEQCRFELAAAVDVNAARHDVPPILPREAMSGLREATAVALASDWHIEETVEGDKVNGVNEYNLDIARRRCERYFAGLIYLVRYHQDHFAIRDLILWLGGDLITGYLREEDLEDNGASPVQAIAILVEWLSEGIRAILQGTDLEVIRVVCNSGNHGRLTKKMQPRTREANSIEWLLYRMLAREFAHEPRIVFVLPHGSQTYVDVYDWTIRFTHGDETKFGGGVGGIMIPIRKAIAKWQTVRHADLNVIGHYHQEHFLRDLVVNGSLVGYNEYALSIAAPYEDPRQGFFLMDKHRGLTFPATIWVADRDGKHRAA